MTHVINDGNNTAYISAEKSKNGREVRIQQFKCPGSHLNPGARTNASIYVYIRSATEPEQNEFPHASSFYERFQGKFLMIRSEKFRIRYQYVDLTFPTNFWHKATILEFSASFLSFIHSHFQTLSCRS
jgi:hypothetical protein